jgi:hypothetical protein
MTHLNLSSLGLPGGHPIDRSIVVCLHLNALHRSMDYYVALYRADYDNDARDRYACPKKSG